MRFVADDFGFPQLSLVLTLEVHVPPLPMFTVPEAQLSEELVKKSFVVAPALTVMLVDPVTAACVAVTVAVSALTSVAFSAVVLTPLVKATVPAGFVARGSAW